MLPPLHRLPLQTGEFYSLNQDELKKFNEQEAVDPISLDPFQLDVRRHGLYGWRKVVPFVRLNENTWRTFRVRSKDKNSNGDYAYQYYRSRSLWEHYRRSVDGQEPRDPLTRQRIWLEDWMDLHAAYDPDGDIPNWVLGLDSLEKYTHDSVPVLPVAPPDPAPPAPQRQHETAVFLPTVQEMVDQDRRNRERRIWEDKCRAATVELDRLLLAADVSMRLELQQAQTAERLCLVALLQLKLDAMDARNARLAAFYSEEMRGIRAEERERELLSTRRVIVTRRQEVIQMNDAWKRRASDLLGVQLSDALYGQMRGWDDFVDLVVRNDRAPTLHEMQWLDQALRAVEAQISIELPVPIHEDSQTVELERAAQQLLASITKHQQARTRAVEALEGDDLDTLTERLADSVTGAFPVNVTPLG
jgi:hypothetical protein